MVLPEAVLGDVLATNPSAHLHASPSPSPMLPWIPMGYVGPLTVVTEFPLLPLVQTPAPAGGLAGSMFPPGLSAPPGTPSHGSTLHATGTCRPCAWFWKPGGCQNGEQCGHCHLCPEGEIKMRKKCKVAAIRMGFGTPFRTPNTMKDVTDKSAFFPARDRSCSGSEQESTTCCSSPDQESLAPPSPSGDEESGSTVMSCVELEKILQSPLPSLQAAPNTPSHGSVEHAAGNCKPCAWFWKPRGCQNEENCKYCHVCTEGELKARRRDKHMAIRLGLVTPKAEATSEQEAKCTLKLTSCV